MSYDSDRLLELERQLGRLRLTLFLAFTGISVVALSAFKATHREKFTELEVERINIVEPDGRVRMVLSNRERSPAPLYKGKPFAYEGGTRAGVIFYDDEGSENGGLTFRGKLINGKPSAAGHLSFDQYGQDQVINLEYQEGGGRRQQGLTISDHADVPLYDVLNRYRAIQSLPAGAAKTDSMRAWTEWQGGVAWGAQRLFLGRDQHKAALIDLRDAAGRSRLRISVDSTGSARIDFLNDSGAVIRTLRGTDH